jgi:hypothetical protein
MSRIPRLLLTLAALALLAAFPSAAAAGSHHHHRARAADRNHDGLPDAWERKFHLSLRVNEARRDQDHDGLTNMQEFRARLNPRSDDSNGDGVPDAQENAGTVSSFTGGVLTIALLSGDSVHGTVDANTEIECITPGQADVEDEQGDDDSGSSTSTARAADDGGSGDGGSTSGSDDGDRSGSGDGDGQGDDNATMCDASALTPGATIHEAELAATSGGLRFEKVGVLVPATSPTP